MIRTPLCSLTLFAVLALPCTVCAAQESSAESQDESVESNSSTETSEIQSGDDPVTARLRTEVMRYYESIGLEPSPAQVASGLDSARFMLLDGISIQRISAAVSKAIGLHSPGRQVSFEVAVPLRILPNESSSSQAQRRHSAEDVEQESETDREDDNQASILDTFDDESSEANERRMQRKEAQEARRNRIRLHRQWQKRTMNKRILLTVGVPTLAIPYSVGFFAASLMVMDGAIPRSWGFVTTVPVVGTLLLSIWTEGEYPPLALLTVSQAAGLATLIIGLAMKSKHPHKDDPTALRLGKKPNGAPAVTLRAAPMGLGGILQGRF
jgi:hypothetical protein